MIVPFTQGVAPGWHIVPLQGAQEIPMELTPCPLIRHHFTGFGPGSPALSVSRFSYYPPVLPRVLFSRLICETREAPRLIPCLSTRAYLFSIPNFCANYCAILMKRKTRARNSLDQRRFMNDNPNRDSPDENPITMILTREEERYPLSAASKLSALRSVDNFDGVPK